MGFELTADDVASPTTKLVKERIEQGRGCVVVGRPGTGKTHAVRAAVNGAAWIDLAQDERQFDQFFADLAAQVQSGAGIIRALRSRDAASVCAEAELALGMSALVIDRGERLRFEETWGWDDPVEAIWRPDQALLARWLDERMQAHPVVVVARGRKDFFPERHRVQHVAPQKWPVRLDRSDRGFRDWPALAEAVGNMPAGLWVGALLLELLDAGEFNALVRALAFDDEPGDATPLDALRELLSVLRRRMPDDWRRVFATVLAIDGAPAEVLEQALSPEDLATLRYLEGLEAISRRKDILSIPPALLLAGPIAELSALERQNILTKVADALLQRVPVVEEPDARSAQWVVRAHALYVETGNLDAALRTAKFRVGGLVHLARSASFAGDWREAQRIYGIIEPLAAHDPRVHSYVVHYQHMNGLWANALTRDSALDGLRRARDLWPENALWWQREAEVLLDLGRGRDALGTIEQAYSRVPEHPRRDLFLRVRPAAHAVTDAVGAYVDALRILEPLGHGDLASNAEARAHADAIFARWSTGVPLPELGRGAQAHLVFHRPVQIALERLADDDFRSESRALERAARATTALGALDQLAGKVADELRRLVETPSTRLDAPSVRRKGILIGLIDLLNSDVGLPFASERWLLGRLDLTARRFLPVSSAFEPIDLDEAVALPPAGPHTLYFAKFPVRRDGRPSGAPADWKLAGSGRSLDELWKAMQQLADGAHG